MGNEMWALGAVFLPKGWCQKEQHQCEASQLTQGLAGGWVQSASQGVVGLQGPDEEDGCCYAAGTRAGQWLEPHVFSRGARRPDLHVNSPNC